MLAIAFNEFPQTPPAKRAQRRIDGDAPGTPRLLSRKCARIAFSLSHLDVVRRLYECLLMGLWMSDQSKARVVWQIEPFMTIGRYRVSLFNTCNEMTQGWAYCSPKPNRPVNMKPCSPMASKLSNI
jgi:hypothetical protein